MAAAIERPAAGYSPAALPRSDPSAGDIDYPGLFLECAYSLQRRQRYAQAVACMIDAVRHDPAALKARLAQRGDRLAGVLAPCLDILERCRAETASPPEPPTAVATDRRCISVVVCSRDDAKFAAVAGEYRRVLRSGQFEIVRIADASSLAEGYNRGIARCRGDIVVFSHDDIRVLSADFREELLSALDRFDLVGIAGATRLAGPQWISSPAADRRQLVCYPAPDPDHGPSCAIDGPQGVRWHEDLQCLDGVFIAARREALTGLAFDGARYDGFHFYDLDFSYRAYRAGLRLAVCPRLGIMHASGGNYADPAWRRYAEIFCRQYDLPMVFLPATSMISFAAEEDLAVFLRTYFTWQDTGADPPPSLAQSGRPAGGGTVLHIGCGDKTIREHAGPGFRDERWTELRMDADPAAHPDLLGSITDLSAIDSGSIDAVFSSHVLEHLYLHEVPAALAEIRRVLRPGGFTLAWVPDLQAAARWIAEDRLFEVIGSTPYGPLTPFDLVFSHRGAVGRDRPHMAHHCGFTLGTLLEAHRCAGFSAIGRARISGVDLQVLAMPGVAPAGLLAALAALYFSD